MLCPDKITTNEWLEIMETAHLVGLKTTSTIMFGHLDSPHHWARHLLLLRSLARKTGGFTEFVPLPFVHMQAPIYLKGRARKGPTRRECVLMHAVARLVLHPFITNIQVFFCSADTLFSSYVLVAQLLQERALTASQTLQVIHFMD
jgi:FO synthase